MLKYCLALIFLSLTWLQVFPQNINSWFDYFSSRRLKELAAGQNILYAASYNTVLLFDLQSREMERLGALNGLSDSKITGIFYSPSFDALAIAYENGNFDLLQGNSIYNLPFLHQDISIPRKTIRTITANDTYFYIGGDFGIISLDPRNRIFVEKCLTPGDITVYSLAINGQLLYAATNDGIYYTDLTQNFADFSNWTKINVSGAKQLRTYASSVYFSTYQNNSTQIYKLDGSSAQLLIDKAGYYGFKVIDAYVYLYGQDITEYDTLGNPLRTINVNSQNPTYITDLVKTGGRFYASDLYNGILEDFGQNTIIYDSPLSDLINTAKIINGKLYILYRPDSTDLLAGIQAFYSVWDGQAWQHYFLPLNSPLTAVAADKTGDNHLFFGTDGSGLAEVIDGQLTAVYDQNNSPLRSDNTGVTITDLFTDSQNTLWILCSQSENPVVRYQIASGQWETEPLATVAAHLVTGNFFLTQNNILWANLFDNGVLAIDYNTGHSRVFYPQPAIGNSVNNLAQDKDGLIWMATSDGAGYFEPYDIDNIVAVRPKVEITLNDTTIYAYLLDNIRVTSVAVDEANRKWFGTLLSGIFFVSPDAQTQYGAFNRYNGSLPVNDVYGIYQDKAKGTVLFNTDIGLIAYQSDASAPKDDFAQVKIFPNPVRPGFNGLITIAGLMYNTLVKITDIEGNVVYETVSQGGTATWDGRTLDGKPVASGVYLVFCIDEQNTQKCVKKLLIVR